MKKINLLSPTSLSKKKQLTLPTVNIATKENSSSSLEVSPEPSSRPPFTSIGNQPTLHHSHHPRKKLKASRLNTPIKSGDSYFKPRIHHSKSRPRHSRNTSDLSHFSHSSLSRSESPNSSKLPHSLSTGSLSTMSLPGSQPPSPNQSRDHLVDNIIKIQSVVRGFISRQSFKEFRDKSFITIIKNNASNLLNAFRSIENRVNLNFVTGNTTNEDFNKTISELVVATDKFKLLLPDINQLAQPLHTPTLSKLRLLRHQLDDIQENTHTISKSAGFSTISDALDFISPNWKSKLSSDSIERLSLLNTVFSPSGFCIATGKNPRLNQFKFNVTDSSSITTKRQTTVISSDLSNQVPHLSKFKLFEPEIHTLFDRIHGAELYIPFPAKTNLSAPPISDSSSVECPSSSSDSDSDKTSSSSRASASKVHVRFDFTDLSSSRLSSSTQLIPMDYFKTDDTDITKSSKLSPASIESPTDSSDDSQTYLVLKGYVKNDGLNLTQLSAPYSNKLAQYKSTSSHNMLIPFLFRRDFLEQYNLRDFLVNSPIVFEQNLRDAHSNYQSLSKMPLPQLVKKFTSHSPSEQVNMISLLLMNKSSIRGSFLFDLMSSIIPEFDHVVRQCMHFKCQENLSAQKDHFEEMKKKLTSISDDDTPLDVQIMATQMDDETKSNALSKSKQLDRPSSEAGKIKNWLTTLLKIPFGNYISQPVSLSDPPLKIKQHLESIQTQLDSAVHGHDEAKEALIRVIGQWISNKDSQGMVIGLQGPPGNGKTTFAKEGVAKALGRPFSFLSLGGMTDSAYLIGHDFTYVGSKWGQIVDCLIRTKCMNPVILFDELDKVSMTEHGREIIGILTHLTDSSQNQTFQDKYFSGINFDLSKALIIFTFNDASKIDPILRDRMSMINTKPLSLKDKLVIAENYLMPKILETLGFKPGDITIDASDIDYLVSTFTLEAGVRRLKEFLFSICRDINLNRLLEPSFKLPIKITREKIDTILAKKPKVEPKTVGHSPLLGTVNGLYATAAGSGGLTIIQSFRSPSDKRLGLELTGSQGDVMQESMKTAKTVAWNLLPKTLQDTIYKDTPFGLHIHVPETSTPKDGPSAGGAITVSLVSQLTGIPIQQNVAMTGEIDLNGNITKIGGLIYKLQGAKRAGVTKVLIPNENKSDLDEIIEENPGLIDDTFEVIPVEHVHQCLAHALVENDMAFENAQSSQSKEYKK